MAVEISPALAGFMKALTGMDVPQGNEDLLREVAVLYEGVAEDLLALRSAILELMVEVKANWQGEAADSFIAVLRPFVASDVLHEASGDRGDYLGKAAESAVVLARVGRDTGNQFEYAKWMLFALLAWTVADLAAIAATAWWNWMAPIEAWWVRVLARWGIGKTVARLVAHISTQMALQVTAGVLMDVIIQAKQFMDGHRDEWSAENTLGAIEFAVIAGLIGGGLSGFAPGLTKGIGNVLGADFQKVLAGDLAKVLGDAPSSGGVGGVAGDLSKVFAGDSGGLVKGFKGVEVRTGGRAADDLGLGGNQKIPGSGAKAGGELAPADILKKVGNDLRQVAGPNQASGFMARYLRVFGDADADLFRGLGVDSFTRKVLGDAGEFVERMAAVFERHFGSVMRADLARELGRDYAESFAVNWSRKNMKDLQGDLRKVLAGYEDRLGRATVDALADDVPYLVVRNLQKNYAGTFGYKVADYGVSAATGGTTMVLATGFYNLLFGPDHEFETGVAAFGAGALMGALGRAGRQVIGEPIELRNLPSADELHSSVRAMSEKPALEGSAGGSGGSGRGGDSLPS
ncbi:hypothetical protein KIH74_35590, partial [Kineosporia sp. J2-2]